MNPPESLPAKMFLLAFDLPHQRLPARDELGYTLRAAALAALVLNGQLRDEDGKAAVAGKPPDTDPVLDELWHAIEADPSRSWRRWVERGRKQTFDAVRDQHLNAHVIKAERERFLGLFPYTRFTVRDTRTARRVADEVSRAIRGGQAASRVGQEVAALAALAAAGQMRVVLNGRDRHQYRTRLDRFGEPIQPVVHALQRAIRTKRAAASGG
ncbi:GPP34 family phosphoprotein [Amycolatopsis sp. GM8]|uniref:GOLPH3/VPS74 family protein n=1 Tax=Amycolatopsis sp. GM8 TaxID=2896530 RepID=UPI001F1CBAE8|nr:GPP34 family phosphoprotein [Amycolatopsis sp. GM8]